MTESNVDEKLFIKDITPEAVYLLGFIWADGYIKKKKEYVICMQIKKEDFLDLKEVFFSVGNWYTWEKDGLVTIRTKNKRLHSFLTDMDYQIKSGTSADKIVEFIPDKYKNLFFRGLMDGDGHWSEYGQKRGGGRRCCITSCIYQDWSFVENLLNSINVEYHIYKRKIETGGASYLDIAGRKNMIRYGEYLYKGFSTIGLKRKKDIFLEIKKGEATSDYRNPVICIDNNKFYWSMKEAAGEYGMSYKSLWNHLSGKSKTFAGKKWRKATEEEKIEQLS